MNSLDTIYLHVTKRCNLSCSYCYFSAGDPLNDELSTNEWLNVIDEISRINPKRVVFTGGEPLLRDDIFEIAAHLRKKKKNIRRCIVTNGTIISEDNTKNIVACFNEVRISIDGIREVNDHTRGKGTFIKILDAFRHILDVGGDPIAFITVTSNNLSHIKETLNFLINHGIVKIHVSPVKLFGRAKDETLKCNIQEMNKQVIEFWQDYFGLTLKKISRTSTNCGIGKYLTINPDGAVYPCHVITLPEFYLGNIKNNGLYSIFNCSKLFRKLREVAYSDFIDCPLPYNNSSQFDKCFGIAAKQGIFKNKLLALVNDNTSAKYERIDQQ